MEEPMVSVLLVSYNEEKYIKKALDSILGQKTNFKYEIICHDDASTDSTQDIILSYQKKYPNVIIPILQKENKMQKGHQIVVEYCYPVARGKYISYCDADDYWIDDYKLQKAFDFLEQNPDYSLCLHNFNYLYDEDNRIELSKCGDKDRDYSVVEFIKWDCDIVPQLGTSMFRRELAANRPELFIKIGGGKNSMRPISDQPLYIFLAMRGKVRYFSSVMSIWRRHGNNWSNYGDKSKEIQFYNDKKEFLNTLEKEYPELDEKSIAYERRNCDYLIGWMSEDYSLAWKNLKYVDVRLITRIFIFLARLFPGVAHVIRKKHR